MTRRRRVYERKLWNWLRRGITDSKERRVWWPRYSAKLRCEGKRHGARR